MSSLFSTVYADAPAEEPKAEETQEVSEEPAKETVEEEEEPEPEDVSTPPPSRIFSSAVSWLKRTVQLQPILREECEKSPQCAPFTKHYLHCQEKVNGGHGYKGEDCVEEL